MQQLIVRGAPQNYICQKNSWENLPNYIEKYQAKRVLILHGKKSWEVVKTKVSQISLSVEAVFYQYYGGECSDINKQKIGEFCVNNQISLIIAIGGGKVLDLAKLVAANYHLNSFLLPTLAATCAAYTPLSVVYDEMGTMLRYDIFDVATPLVLVDPIVLVESPKELMIAGIGDTLAKWYEANAIISQLNPIPVEISVAHFAAKQCQINLLTDGINALKAMDKQEVDDSFIKVIETNILLAGMVGGYGDDYGRTAGAHSIHDALTLIPESHNQLHGNKVAYGILVQLILTHEENEFEQLIPYYHQLGLPTSLKAMGLQDITLNQLKSVAERATLPDENIHYMAESITADSVLAAMNKLEKLNL